MSGKVSYQSLCPVDHEGYLTKQGGSYKSWKRRLFVLKGTELYYFKNKKDTDMTGVIHLSKESFVKREPNYYKKKNVFAVGTTTRVFFMFPDDNTPGDADAWIRAISNILATLNPQPVQVSTPAPAVSQPIKSTVSTPAATPAAQQPVIVVPPPASVQSQPQQATSTPNNNADLPDEPDFIPRGRLAEVKECIPYLTPANQIHEFWEIWQESLPQQEEIDGGSIVFEFATSATLSKLTWRCSGPQTIFIQKMVDFFWGAGAPETEIDRLNDVGAMLNPLTIGSWIDMSEKGGMDGGWFFPIEVTMDQALASSDEGSACTTLMEWASAKGITRCFYVGRDMGAAPPRQTEVKFQLTGNVETQLNTFLSAHTTFNIPAPPAGALNLIKTYPPPECMAMAVTTSSEGVVRLGILVPVPATPLVDGLCSLAGGDPKNLNAIAASLQVEGPDFVELQFLTEGFGYDVYQEGFDVMFHYFAGEEFKV